MPNTYKSDNISTYFKDGKIFANYCGELTTENGFYKITITEENVHLIKRRRKDAIMINNEWVKTKDFRLGDVVYYDGKELFKIDNKL